MSASHLLNISFKMGKEATGNNERTSPERMDHVLLEGRRRNVLLKGLPFRNLVCALGSRERGKKWLQENILKSGHCKLVLDF